MRDVYCGAIHLAGKVVPQARYLGELFSYSGSTTAACQHRLRKAKAAWFSMGKFWTAPGSSRWCVRMVFRTLVFEAAVGGLVPFVLGKSDYDAIDTFLVAKGRKLMHGGACRKTKLPDGNTKYQAVPNSAIWKFLGLAGARTELMVRRLQWWQRLVRHSDLHSSLFAVLFGQFGFEQNGPLHADGSLSNTANPWLKQSLADLESLRGRDYEHVTEAVDGKPLRLFSQDIKIQFLYVDPTILRRRFLTVAIPPPEYDQSDQVPEEELAPHEETDTYRCDLLREDGSVCVTHSSEARRRCICTRSKQWEGNMGMFPWIHTLWLQTNVSFLW